MEVLGDYVFKKEVDKSLLTEGFSIPLEFQVIFKRNIGKFLQRGESKEIALYLNGKSYKAQIKNQKFDDFKYKHKDIVQIRYNRNSNIADEFKKVFYSSYRFITEQRLQKKLLNGNREDKIYINRCQICGIRVGEKYDSNIVEAHHIDSFVKSLNNNMNNIMILCPNHHNIIHDVNPYFNKKSNIFVFENGYKESLQLNYHL